VLFGAAKAVRLSASTASRTGTIFFIDAHLLKGWWKCQTSLTDVEILGHTPEKVANIINAVPTDVK
jgi:hypothetical protein